MESENILHTLTVDFLSDKDLIITHIDLFTTHYAYILKATALICELSQAFCCDVGSSEVNISQKSELVSNKLGTRIVNLSAPQEVELIDELQFFEFGDAII